MNNPSTDSAIDQASAQLRDALCRMKPDVEPELWNPEVWVSADDTDWHWTARVESKSMGVQISVTRPKAADAIQYLLFLVDPYKPTAYVMDGGIMQAEGENPQPDKCKAVAVGSRHEREMLMMEHVAADLTGMPETAKRNREAIARMDAIGTDARARMAERMAAREMPTRAQVCGTVDPAGPDDDATANSWWNEDALTGRLFAAVIFGGMQL